MGGSTFSRGKGVPEPMSPGLAGRGGGGGVVPGRRGDGGGAGSEEWVASEFRWNFGGSDVYVTGSWDGWSSKTPLYRGEAGVFWVVVALAAGRFQYKYVVDGNWRHSPAEETELDDRGNLNNVRWVRPVKPEYASDDPLLPAGPSSPAESYDCCMLREADLKGEPPTLPPQLDEMPRLTESAKPDEAIPRSSYVCLNHLYVATTDDDGTDGVTTLQMFSRYKSKNIATSFVTGFPLAEPQQVVTER